MVKVKVRTKKAVNEMRAMGGKAETGIGGEKAGTEECRDYQGQLFSVLTAAR